LPNCADAVDVRQIGVDLHGFLCGEFLDADGFGALDGEFRTRLYRERFGVSIEAHRRAFDVRHDRHRLVERFARFTDHRYFIVGFVVGFVREIESEDIDTFAYELSDCREISARGAGGRDDFRSFFHRDAPWGFSRIALECAYHTSKRSIVSRPVRGLRPPSLQYPRTAAA